MNQIPSKIIVVLIFILAGVLFFHNLTSINIDIGRHIGLGKIIWEMKEVPKTNLLSFTAPDFSFINHHWLGEVIFYGIYSLGGDWITGLRLIIIFKAIVLLAVYLILFLAVKKHNIFAIVLGFLVSIFVFSARTEPRPEIFSYLIFAAYLLVIHQARDTKGIFAKMPFVSLLWLLPVLQLFWVNLHIYFIMGPFLFGLFLIDQGINSSGLRFWRWNFFRVSSLEFRVFIFTILVNFINPNFYEGAIYPFKVFNNYGYGVVENSSLFYLSKYLGFWPLQDKLTLISLVLLIVSFIISFCKNKKAKFGWLRKRCFDLLLISVTIALSFKMQRNTPLYALSSWPVMSENLDSVFSSNFFKRSAKIFYAIGLIILISPGYLIVSNRFYDWLDSAKKFGLGVSGAAQNGTDFIKANKIEGPVFNNFDIGSYLAWQLYPEQKVFVDGRPEAYPADFFENIYKPMQRDEKIWQEMSEQYGINYIFFAHTDMTEWADEFLTRISKDKEWSLVFLNDAIVIFIKNNDSNREVIDKYRITEQNVEEKVANVLGELDKKDDNAFINLGNALFRFRWLQSSAEVFEALITKQPDNPYGYQGAGYAYVTMNDPKTQEKAGQNLERAIDLGFKTANNYLTLGIINANLGKLIEAEENLIKAVEMNSDNMNARSVLRSVRRKQGAIEQE